MKNYILLIYSVLLLTPIYLGAQTYFNGENAFASVIKVNGGNVNHYISEYLYRFDSKNFSAYQEDEFEMAKTINELKHKIDKTPANKEFYLNYTASFGKYNFDKNEFGFQPFPEKSTVEIFDFVFSPKITTNTSASIVFSNGAEVDALPMDFDKANFLVKMRKDKRTGKVDRTVHLKIYFHLTDYVEYEDFSDSKQKVTLFANITKIEAYENNAYLTDPLSVISTEHLMALQEAAKNEKKKKEKPEVETVNELNKYLGDQKMDNELKVKILKTAVEHYNE